MLELALQLVRVSTEHLYDLGILDTVEKLDCLEVVHHTGNRVVVCLCVKRGRDTRAQCDRFGCSALDTDEETRGSSAFDWSFSWLEKGFTLLNVADSSNQPASKKLHGA